MSVFSFSDKVNIFNNEKSFIPVNCQAGACEFRVANSFDLRKRAYGFTYSTYQDRGLGNTCQSEMWYSLHELLPNAVTLIMTKDNEVVASVTMVCDTMSNLPADEIYSKRLDEWRTQGYKMIEVCSLCIHPRFRRRFDLLGKFFSLIHCFGYYVLSQTHLIITVMPNHASFYKKQLCFQEIDEAGFHSKTGVDCRLLLMDLLSYQNTPAEEIRKSFFRYYHSLEEMESIGEILKAEVKPLSLNEFTYFAAQRPEIINGKNMQELKKIHELFIL